MSVASWAGRVAVHRWDRWRFPRRSTDEDRGRAGTNAAARARGAAIRRHADGTLGDLTPFAERGGESVAVDAVGNVYVANGQIFVYDEAGAVIGQIDVPERPIDIVFGGPDRRTLFILGHHTLYAVQTLAPGATSPWTR